MSQAASTIELQEIAALTEELRSSTATLGSARSLARSVGTLAKNSVGLVRSFFRLKRKLRQAIKIIYSVDPSGWTDQQIEGCIAKIRDASEGLRRLVAVASLFRREAKKLDQAAYWIERGYPPSRPPTEAQREALRRELNSRLMTALDRSGAFEKTPESSEVRP